MVSRSAFWLIDFIIFQCAWFSVALWKDMVIWPLLFLLIFRVLISPERAMDIKAMATALGVALLIEPLLVGVVGVVYFSDWLIPLWILALWALLGASLNHSLSWMRRLPTVWQGGIGAFAGTCAMLAAERFGALQIPEGVVVLLGLALVWGMGIALLFKGERYARKTL